MIKPIRWVTVLTFFLAAGFSQAQAAEDFKVVVTAAFCSERGMSGYEDLARYIEKKTGIPMRIVGGMNYETSVRMLQQAKVQGGFLCGYTYTKKKNEAGLELVAAPVMAHSRYRDVPKYISYVIVPADSPAESFESLKGKTYLFSDPLSNSGYNVPRYELAKLGHTPQEFFREIKFSGSHEKSIQMIADKEADGASVDSLVWDYDQAMFPADTARTKIIEEHPAGGIPPLTILKSVDAGIKTKIQDAFIHMHEDPDGEKVLEGLLIKKFVFVGDDNYDDIRDKEKIGLEMNNKA